MSMEADLVTLLSANAGIDAVIGKVGTVPTISWGLPKQGWPWPALVISMVDPGREYTHGGADGLDGPRVQFDALAETDVQATALADAVLDAIEAGGTVAGARKFHPGWLESRTTVDEGNLEGGRPLFRVMQEFQFFHEEI